MRTGLHERIFMAEGGVIFMTNEALYFSLLVQLISILTIAILKIVKVLVFILISTMLVMGEEVHLKFIFLQYA